MSKPVHFMVHWDCFWFLIKNDFVYLSKHPQASQKYFWENWGSSYPMRKMKANLWEQWPQYLNIGEVSGIPEPEWSDSYLLRGFQASVPEPRGPISLAHLAHLAPDWLPRQSRSWFSSPYFIPLADLGFPIFLSNAVLNSSFVSSTPSILELLGTFLLFLDLLAPWLPLRTWVLCTLCKLRPLPSFLFSHLLPWEPRGRWGFSAHCHFQTTFLFCPVKCLPFRSTYPDTSPLSLITVILHPSGHSSLMTNDFISGWKLSSPSSLLLMVGTSSS